MALRFHRLDLRALAAAALAAPAAAWLIFLLLSLLASAATGFDLTSGNVVVALLWTLIIALWGFLPALLFGALAMGGLARLNRSWSDGLVPRLLAGLFAAAVYAAAGLVTGTYWDLIAIVAAPWVLILAHPVGGGEAAGWMQSGVIPVICAILASGPVGGWVYHRFARKG